MQRSILTQITRTQVSGTAVARMHHVTVQTLPAYPIRVIHVLPAIPRYRPRVIGNTRMELPIILTWRKKSHQLTAAALSATAPTEKADPAPARVRAAMIKQDCPIRRQTFFFLKIFLICLFTILFSSTCVYFRPAEKHDFGDECKHCHGKRLQGIRNVKLYCSACHDLKPLRPGEISNAERKEAVLSEPHIHTTKNLFQGTPSCFDCHRRTDF